MIQGSWSITEQNFSDFYPCQSRPSWKSKLCENTKKYFFNGKSSTSQNNFSVYHSSLALSLLPFISAQSVIILELRIIVHNLTTFSLLPEVLALDLWISLILYLKWQILLHFYVLPSWHVISLLVPWTSSQGWHSVSSNQTDLPSGWTWFSKYTFRF